MQKWWRYPCYCILLQCKQQTWSFNPKKPVWHWHFVKKWFSSIDKVSIWSPNKILKKLYFSENLQKITHFLHVLMIKFLLMFFFHGSVQIKWKGLIKIEFNIYIATNFAWKIIWPLGVSALDISGIWNWK